MPHTSSHRSRLGRFPFLAGLAGGAAATALILGTLLASGAVDASDTKVELEPRVRVWRVMDSGREHWPQLPPEQTLDVPAQDLVIDNDAITVAWAGTRDAPFAFDLRPSTPDDGVPALPQRTTWAQGPDTTLDFTHNQQLTLQMRTRTGRFDVTTRQGWLGLLMRGRQPGNLVLPVDPAPRGASWLLLNLTAATVTRIPGTTTSQPLRPRNTYVVIFPGAQQLTVIRSTSSGRIDIPHAYTQPRPVQLELASNGKPMATFFSSLPTSLRRAGTGGRLVAGAPGRHVVISRTGSGPEAPLAYSRAELSPAPTRAGVQPTETPVVAIPEQFLGRLYDQAGQTG